MMKRWLTHLTIGGYLSLLSYGLLCHTFSFHITNHPAMYFLIWDMYCGWSGYETRLHVIGEGESGRYYELDPAPWREFRPYGDIGRRHYDFSAQFVDRFAQNTLRHTDHEPIRRIAVFEEAWPKKYNLNDDLWAARYDEPKEHRSYYRLRAQFDGQGRLTSRDLGWTEHLAKRALLDNPRLRQDVVKGRPFYTLDRPRQTASSVAPAGYQAPAASTR